MSLISLKSSELIFLHNHEAVQLKDIVLLQKVIFTTLIYKNLKYKTKPLNCMQIVNYRKVTMSHMAQSHLLIVSTNGLIHHVTNAMMLFKKSQMVP